MKLSTKGRYAVMAMADLTKYSGEKPVSLADISERQGISQTYLEQLFMWLRKFGLVQSVRGPGGGYLLARDAKDINIIEIIMASDESLEFIRCSGGHEENGCVGGERCLTHELWEALGMHVRNFLSMVSLDDVINSNISMKLIKEQCNLDQNNLVDDKKTLLNHGVVVAS